MRLYPSDDVEHSAATELLPWFVNGTLEPHEHARVARHLRDCLACNKELALLREVQEMLVRDRTAIAVMPDAAGTTLRAVRRQRLDIRRSLVRWRVLAAVQLTLIAVLGVALTVREQPKIYHTLAGRQVAPIAQDSLLVVFDPNAAEKDVRDAIVAVHARIVDGPSAPGAYTLRVPSDERDHAIAQLRAQRGVLLVERGSVQ